MSKIDDWDCPPPCGPDQMSGCIDLCKSVTCPAGSCCSYGACKPCGSGGGSYDDAGGSGYYDDAGNWMPGGGGMMYGDLSSGCACNTSASERVPLAGLLFVLIGLAVIRRRR